MLHQEAALDAALAGCLATDVTAEVADAGTAVIEMETVDGRAPEPTETADTTPKIGTAAIEPAEIEHTDKEIEMMDNVGTVFMEMRGKVVRRSGRQAEKAAK